MLIMFQKINYEPPYNQLNRWDNYIVPFGRQLPALHDDIAEESRHGPTMGHDVAINTDNIAMIEHVEEVYFQGAACKVSFVRRPLKYTGYRLNDVIVLGRSCVDLTKDMLQ